MAKGNKRKRKTISSDEDDTVGIDQGQESDGSGEVHDKGSGDDDENDNEEHDEEEDDSVHGVAIVGPVAASKQYKTWSDWEMGERPTSWMRNNLGQIIGAAVQSVVAHHQNKVPESTVAHEMANSNTKETETGTLPLRVAMKNAAFAKYVQGWSGPTPMEAQRGHYNCVRDFVIRSFNAREKYGRLRFEKCMTAISTLSEEWKKFFTSLIFPILNIKSSRKSISFEKSSRAWTWRGSK
jgi:hypothetical protein